MKPKLAQAYMKTAEIFAELSHARRLKVGCVIVKEDRIISIGFNGTPTGWDNNCEDKEYIDTFAGGWLSREEIEEQWPYEDENGKYKLKTKAEVLHSESNAISKLARSSESGFGADLFVTHSPCLDCAKLIYQSGIKRVYFGNAYRSSDGIEFLRASGVEVKQIEKGE
jgi:dCMP deaminase